MWAKGDGALTQMYPELSYVDGAPNSTELLLISIVILLAGVLLRRRAFALFGAHAVTALILANILHDLYQHLLRDAVRMRGDPHYVLSGPLWVAAVMESVLIRMFSELGRTVGQLERGEFGMLGRRFDWFTGRAGSGLMEEEKRNSQQRLVVLCLSLGLKTTGFLKTHNIDLSCELAPSSFSE
jgi:hypothetical protein